MKNYFFLLVLFVSVLFTSCHSSLTGSKYGYLNKVLVDAREVESEKKSVSEEKAVNVSQSKEVVSTESKSKVSNAAIEKIVEKSKEISSKVSRVTSSIPERTQIVMDHFKQKASFAAAPQEKYIDLPEILISALVLVLVLVLLAFFIPKILTVIIALLVVVLIVAALMVIASLL